MVTNIVKKTQIMCAKVINDKCMRYALCEERVFLNQRIISILIIYGINNEKNRDVREM